MTYCTCQLSCCDSARAHRDSLVEILDKYCALVNLGCGWNPEKEEAVKKARLVLKEYACPTPT
jgi:hypothetical protein